MSEKLVLHHTYERGIAFDVSEQGNHGLLLGGVASGAPAEPGTMRFNGGDTWVKVRPGPRFRDMRSLRVRVRAMVDAPTHLMPHRHNLVEGHLSFALFVNPDYSLQATILDATGTWSGPATTPGIRLVQPLRWHDIEYTHDGVSTARLLLNGAVVAERLDVPGPIRDVGADGVAIGHWPHPDNRYSLDGWIDRVQIWVHDPEDDLDKLLDDCCVDRPSLDDLLRRVRAEGWTGQRLGDLVREIQDLATEIAVASRAGQAGNAADLRRLTRDGMLALTTRDTAALSGVFGGLRDVMRRSLSDAEIEAYGARAVDQVRRSPVGPLLFPDDDRPPRPDLDRWARLLCLDDLFPPRKPGRGDEPRHPPRTDHDPDTDRPSGKPPPGWGDEVEEPPPDEPGGGEPERPPATDRGAAGGIDLHDAPDGPEDTDAAQAPGGEARGGTDDLA
jgi:hypothetical protein